MSESLSDVLRDMADSPPKPSQTSNSDDDPTAPASDQEETPDGFNSDEPDPPAASASPAQAAIDDEDDDEEMVVVELDDESGEAVGQAVEPAPRSSPRRRTPPRRKPTGGMKGVAVPVLITVGGLLLIPAVWAALLLAGAVTSEREGAQTMAYAMLACWPIALILFAAAGFYFYIMQKEKKEYEASQRKR